MRVHSRLAPIRGAVSVVDLGGTVEEHDIIIILPFLVKY